MDVIGDFAYPACRGVQRDARPARRGRPARAHWIAAGAHARPGHRRRRARPLQRAHGRDVRLPRHQIEAKRRTPGDDVLTALVQAEEDGDRLSRRSSWAKMYAVRQRGTSRRCRYRQRAAGAVAPTCSAAAAAAPDLLPNAVNELLRYDGPNQFVRRIAVQPYTIDGTTIAPR